jgi:hypothetical protein
MDATRKRRTKDRARQAWYAGCRQRRFARFLGFGGGGIISTAVPRSPAADAPYGVRNPLVRRDADQLPPHANLAVHVTPLALALDAIEQAAHQPAFATW